MSTASEAESARYARRRLCAALAADSPPRGTVASLALAVVVLVGLVVTDTIRTPKGGPPLTDGTAVATAEGEIYVVESGIAYPTLNRASALLVSDRLISATREDLAALPRGPARGIRGAPSELPDPGALMGAAWQVCTDPDNGISLSFGTAPYLSPASGETVLLDDGTATWAVRDGTRSITPAVGGPAIRTIPELTALIPLTGVGTPVTAPVDVTGSTVCAQSDPAAPFARPSTSAAQRSRQSAQWVSVHTWRGRLDLTIRPGGGVLAERGDGGYWLLTSSGELAPIADQAALRKLGYSHDQAVRIPHELLSLLPPGPELSIDAARAPPS